MEFKKKINRKPLTDPEVNIPITVDRLLQRTTDQLDIVINILKNGDEKRWSPENKEFISKINLDEKLVEKIKSYFMEQLQKALSQFMISNSSGQKELTKEDLQTILAKMYSNMVSDPNVSPEVKTLHLAILKVVFENVLSSKIKTTEVLNQSAHILFQLPAKKSSSNQQLGYKTKQETLEELKKQVEEFKKRLDEVANRKAEKDTAVSVIPSAERIAQLSANKPNVQSTESVRSIKPNPSQVRSISISEADLVKQINAFLNFSLENDFTVADDIQIEDIKKKIDELTDKIRKFYAELRYLFRGEVDRQNFLNIIKESELFSRLKIIYDTVDKLNDKYKALISSKDKKDSENKPRDIVIWFNSVKQDLNQLIGYASEKPVLEKIPSEIKPMKFDTIQNAYIGLLKAFENFRPLALEIKDVKLKQKIENNETLLLEDLKALFLLSISGENIQDFEIMCNENDNGMEEFFIEILTLQVDSQLIKLPLNKIQQKIKEKSSQKTSFTRDECEELLINIYDDIHGESIKKGETETDILYTKRLSERYTSLAIIKRIGLTLNFAQKLV